MDSLETTYERYARARESLREFVADNEEMITIYDQLAQEYNSTLAAMKDTIRTQETRERVSYGGFSRSAKSMSRLYVPDRLPQKALLLPGVVKTVDMEAIDRYIVDGRLTEDDVKDSVVEKEATPRVTGPQELKFVF